MSDKECGIAEVVDAFMSAITMDKIKAYKAASTEKEFIDAASYLERGMVDEFCLLFLSHRIMPVEGLLESMFPGKPKLHFLILRRDFIESNYEEMIISREGRPCCADKSGFIIQSLFNHLASGVDIKINYEGKYTYHLPKTVFNSHRKIIDFFEGLHFLYYGNPEKYMKAVSEIYCQESRSSDEH